MKILCHFNEFIVNILSFIIKKYVLSAGNNRKLIRKRTSNFGFKKVNVYVYLQKNRNK